MNVDTIAGILLNRFQPCDNNTEAFHDARNVAWDNSTHYALNSHRARVWRAVARAIDFQRLDLERRMRVNTYPGNDDTALSDYSERLARRTNARASKLVSESLRLRRSTS